MLYGLVLATIVFAQDYLPSAPVIDVRHCGSVDYRPKLPPAKSQGDTSFCFSYTSADLINQRLGANVSALDIAMAFYFSDPGALRRTRDPALREYLDTHPYLETDILHDRWRDDIEIDGPHPFFHHLEGGFEQPALLLANVRGLCAEHDLNSDGGFREHAPVLASFERRALEGADHVGEEVSHLHPRFRDGAADLFHTNWLRWVDSRCQHRAPGRALVPVDYAIARSAADYLVKRTEGRITDADQDRVLKVIDYALDHERVVAIGFNLNTILVKSQTAEDGDHSVTLVGRRPTARGCQYLVRDSSGYDCEDYSSGISRRCADRHLWLKESELRRSLYSVTYLR